MAVTKIEVFSNGAAIITFDGKATSREVEEMREMWQKHASN